MLTPAQGARIGTLVPGCHLCPSHPVAPRRSAGDGGPGSPLGHTTASPALRETSPRVGWAQGWGKASVFCCARAPTPRTHGSSPVTESQNPSMAGVGRDPLWVTQPNPLPKQGHPEQAAQHRVQAGLEYLQRRRLHSLPGQPGPGLRHPPREEVLPRVQLELPLLQFVPIAPCPVTGHHWKESGPVLLTPTLQIFISIY